MSDNNVLEKEQESSTDVEEKSTSNNPLGSSNGVQLNKNISIMPSEPLPQLNKGTIKAYAAVGKNYFSENLFALICEKNLTPRVITALKYSSIINPNLPKLVGFGVIEWELTSDERYCFVYENILDRPLIDMKAKSSALHWNPDMVMNNVVFPMIEMLTELHHKDIVHGEIWPANMYYSGDPSAGKIRLGDCLAAPSSALMPGLYEPIDRALADQGARGMGQYEDDLYSFGVSLAIILRSTDPMKGFSEEQVIESKIENGTYSSLLGKDRFSGALLELLRGLLYDDRQQRWTLEDVHAWADGRRLSPKQSPKRVKAGRPIALEEKKYTRPELFAKDLHTKPDETVRLIEGGGLDQWLERAVEDKVIKSRVERALKGIETADRSAGHAERLCPVLATALYMECPVRYKGISFIPEGFGEALTTAYVEKREIQPYVDVLKYQFILQAVRNKADNNPTSLVSRFDTCRAFITQNKLGFGLERCIYYLNPNCHCLSDIIKEHYVQNPEELVYAYEKMCSRGNPHILFDRHVVAFLSMKDKKNIDHYIPGLSDNEAHVRILAQLQILATIQKKSKLTDLPALSAWFLKNLTPVYERFHDRERRALLIKNAKKMADTGDLDKLWALFGEGSSYQMDYGAFKNAMSEYQKLEKEKEKIETKLKDRKNYGQRTGRQVASFIAVILSAVIILISSYVILM